MDVIYGITPKINAICTELTRNWSGVPTGEHLPLRDYMMALAIRIISSTHFGAFFRNDDNTKALHKLYESVSMYMILRDIYFKTGLL